MVLTKDQLDDSASHRTVIAQLPERTRFRGHWYWHRVRKDELEDDGEPPPLVPVSESDSSDEDELPPLVPLSDCG